MHLICAGLSQLIFSLQVSDDDSYISDVSDSISMDTFSNEGGSERHNSGMIQQQALRVDTDSPSTEKQTGCKETLFCRNDAGSVSLVEECD